MGGRVGEWAGAASTKWLKSRPQHVDQPIVEQPHRALHQRARAAHEPVAVGAFDLDIEQPREPIVVRVVEMAGEHEGDAEPLRGGLEHQRPRIEMVDRGRLDILRSEEHTSELQSLMPITYAVLCLKKKKTH